MEWYYWVIGAAVGMVIYWFITFFIIAPAVIQAFSLETDVLTTSLIIFFGGDAGIVSLAVWGNRRT